MAEMDRRRRGMVSHQLLARDITDPAVLQAMAQVPREAFVPEYLQDLIFPSRPGRRGFPPEVAEEILLLKNLL